MRTQPFATVTRQTTQSVSRRTSLLTLGGVTLAAARPDSSAAKKKKSGADCKQKEKQRCSNDAAACRTTVVASCQKEDGCSAELLCCDACTAGGFLACLIATLEQARIVHRNLTGFRNARATTMKGPVMPTQPFASYTHRAAAAVSRRTSLLILGTSAVAATAAVAHPGVSTAKKKSGNSCKQKAKQRCNRDTAACRSLALTACNNSAKCFATLNGCCAECSANGLVTCILAASE